MMMITSSASSNAAATATVVDVDTISAVADNQATFQVDAGPDPTTADLSRICEEPSPVGPFTVKRQL